ncbi:MAG TPA: tagaturonate epimerase family protein [Verrucomicrobiae bacterium]|nr:tagaturonate epimerase family protein [Verrucomicrobiae bacterium]
MLTKPTVLGLKKSFGFGDRLGLATPGHVAAGKKSDFAPIFAQQSIREMTRTERTAEEVMKAAQKALVALNYTQPWGADADHLKLPEDVRKTAAAGYTFYTIDPSEHVSNQADRMKLPELEAAVARLEADKIFGERSWTEYYLAQKFEVSSRLMLKFTTEQLYRAAVKYGRAIAHSEMMGHEIANADPGRPFEIEVSVDETESPTSSLEHLFFGLELKQRKVPNVVSLAPRFVGDFEKGIDYRGDLRQFEASLREHVEIARYCGPYKLSIHSGSDKFSIYPIAGRVCGELLHVKTAGTSYLEALRVVARVAPALFGEIVTFCRGRFDNDRKSYHLSTTAAQIGALRPFQSKADEALYLDEVVGRQLLHVTFGSVLTMGKDSRGRRFKDGIIEVLQKDSDLHEEVLERHFTKHLSLLNKG